MSTLSLTVSVLISARALENRNLKLAVTAQLWDSTTREDENVNIIFIYIVWSQLGLKKKLKCKSDHVTPFLKTSQEPPVVPPKPSVTS